MNHNSTSFLSKVRNLFWPIYRHEHRKLVPMFLMLFLICINYTILRNMKDALNVTASGAEVIPFIKLWVMLPMAVIASFSFTKLASRFSQERVFYFTISFFLCFFLLFVTVLYPFRDVLHPNATADWLAQILPMGCKGLINMLRNWTFTSFYVMSELWSCMVLSVLFWSFANEVTKVGEAKRFYSFFNMASNSAAIIAGQIPSLCVSFFGSASGQSRDDSSLITQLIIVIACGLATILIFRWLSKNVLNGPEFDEFHENKLQMKKKKKLSIRESLSYLSSSRYLLCIAMLVVGYNLVINLVEVIWKDQLRELYPSRSDFNTYIGHLTTLTGILSMLIAIFIPKMLDRLGWTRTAMITPVTMLITAAGFFILLFFKDQIPGGVFATLGVSATGLIVFIGALQNCFSKASKYSLFDTTKEMAFIPLDHDVKLKGKAAIDGVGSRLGKSGGSVLYQGLLTIFPTLTACAPVVGFILLLVITGWISSTRALGVQFGELVNKEKDRKRSETTDKEEEEGVPLDREPAVSVS